MMTQAVKDGARTDLAIAGGGCRFGSGRVIPCWDLLADALMRTKVVVVIDIFLEHDSQVLFAKEDEMIGALPAEGSD